MVVARVGQPVIDGSGENWMCPYEITASGHSKTFGMHGVDSMQALELTLRIIETEAATLARTQGGSLQWLDEPYESMFAQTSGRSLGTASE